MKLLFYADFLHYKKNVLSISGVPYVRFQYGPVPKDYEFLLASFEKCGIIERDYNIMNDYTIINTKAKQKFDDSLFTDDEIKTMEYVENYFKHYGSKKISEFSHEEDAWKNTEPGEIISYDYADTLHLDFN